jgi:hypothetical protein
METVERSLMQLEDGTGPHSERPFFVPHMVGDDFDREIELSEAVLGLATRDLILVGE